MSFLGAALFLCGAALLGEQLSLPWVLGTLALLSWFAPAVGTILAPFVLAGWLIRSPPEVPVPESPRENLIELQGEVTRPGRCSSSDPSRQVTWLRTPAGRSILVDEPRGRPARHRGQVLNVRGWLREHPRSSQPRLRAEPIGSVRVVGYGSWWRVAWGWLDRVNAWARDRLVRELGPDAAFAAALLLGRSEELPEHERALLRATGCYHYVAVSGFHVGLVGMTLLAFLRRLPCCARGAAGIAFGAVVFYALLCGARPPVVRATILFAAWLWSQKRRRPAAGDAVLAFALLVAVALDPDELLGPGLQLSFVAVVGIQLPARYRPLHRPRGTGSGVQLGRPIARLFVVALAASLATAPLTALHFGTVAPLSPLGSVVVLPWILPEMLGSILLLITSTVLPAFSVPLVVLLKALSQSLFAILGGLDALPGTPLRVAHPSSLAVFVLLLSLYPLSRRRPLPALLLTLLSAGLAWRLDDRWHEPPARLALLPVGHGQALVVQHAEGTDVVDAGTLQCTATAFERLQGELDELHVRSIRRLFLSHLDADHAGFAARLIEERGAAELLLSVAHEALWSSPAPPGSIRGELQRVVALRQTPVRFLVRGDRVGEFEVLWPPRRRFFAANDGSLVLRTHWNRRPVLLPGDLEGPCLAEVARLLTEPLAVLVLPHHGNDDEFLEDFLHAARPLIGLASRGSILAPRVIDLLDELQIPVWTTFEAGRLELP